MPSVPSDPTINSVRSGPAAAAGAPPVRITVPSASTTSSPTTISSILPYRVEYWPAPRDATHPPTVARSKLCGKCPTVSPFALLIADSRSGPDVPGSTSTMPDSVSTDRTPANPVMSRITPPNTGTAAPQTPLRPPDAVTGTRPMLQACITATTSAVDDGRAIRPASCGTSPRSDQCRASGHQSRLDSATPATSSTTSQMVSRTASNSSGIAVGVFA